MIDYRKLYSKEEFNKVFKDTSREGILNQFYYEHIELGKMIDNFNELEKWLLEWREMLDYPDFYEEGIIDCINDTLYKIKELKGEDKE